MAIVEKNWVQIDDLTGLTFAVPVGWPTLTKKIVKSVRIDANVTSQTTGVCLFVDISGTLIQIIGVQANTGLGSIVSLTLRNGAFFCILPTDILYIGKINISNNGQAELYNYIDLNDSFNPLVNQSYNRWYAFNPRSTTTNTQFTNTNQYPIVFSSIFLNLQSLPSSATFSGDFTVDYILSMSTALAPTVWIPIINNVFTVGSQTTASLYTLLADPTNPLYLPPGYSLKFTATVNDNCDAGLYAPYQICNDQSF